MKTTIDITDALADEAKAVARERGESLRMLVESGLRRELDAHRAARRDAPPFEFPVAGGEGLRPGVRAEDLIDYAYGEPAVLP